MIKYTPISEELYEAAEKIVDDLPIFDGSHREAMANQVGVLGELLAERWFEENHIQFTNETHLTTHDYKLADGSTIDVKTKDRTVPPQGKYECSVPLYNHEHQRPTYYLFVSLQRNKEDGSTNVRRFHSGYILGGINQDQLEKLGKNWDAGEVDPTNGTKFWTACKNVYINQLANTDTVSSKWKSISPN
jgi:hypothetical protein